MCLLTKVGLFSSLSYSQARLALALGQASRETHRAGCLVSIRLISALCRSSVTPVPRAGELRARRSAAEERRRFQDCDRPRPEGSPKPGGPTSSRQPRQANARSFHPSRQPRSPELCQSRDSNERILLSQISNSPAKPGAHHAHFTEVISRRQERYSKLPKFNSREVAGVRAGNPSQPSLDPKLRLLCLQPGSPGPSLRRLLRAVRSRPALSL